LASHLFDANQSGVRVFTWVVGWSASKITCAFCCLGWMFY